MCSTVTWGAIIFVAWFSRRDHDSDRETLDRLRCVQWLNWGRGRTQAWGRKYWPSPNGCMVVRTNNNIVVPGEATLSAENGGKPLGGRDSAPNPAGGAHRAPPDPIAVGEGVAAPSPRTSTPLSAFNLHIQLFGLDQKAKFTILH